MLTLASLQAVAHSRVRGDMRRFYRASLRSVVLVKVTGSLSTNENSHNVDLYWRSQDHRVTSQAPRVCPGHRWTQWPLWPRARCRVTGSSWSRSRKLFSSSFPDACLVPTSCFGRRDVEASSKQRTGRAPGRPATDPRLGPREDPRTGYRGQNPSRLRRENLVCDLDTGVQGGASGKTTPAGRPGVRRAVWGRDGF